MNGIAPSELVSAVFQWFKAWTSAPQPFTSVSLAKDPLHALELVATGPQGMRAVVSYHGGQTVGGEQNPGAAVMTHNITVWIGYALGLTVDPNIRVAIGSADRPALLNIIASVDTYVRSLLLPADVTNQILRLVAIQDVVLPDGVPLAAQKLVYAIEAAMPAPAGYAQTTLGDDGLIIMPT